MRNGPSLGAERWGRHFLPVCLHDPPGAMDSTLSSTGGSKEPAPGASWGSAIVRVVFTSGQTLPSFPAYISTPDGYPLLRLAI